MAKFVSKAAIRDSFDEEEETVSDDVDDEVFIRDGRNGYKMDEESGVKKPLMPLRRRPKHAKFAPSSIQEPRRWKMFLAPCCYGIAALSILLGLIALSVIGINYFSLHLSRLQVWFGKNSSSSDKKLIPCTEFAISDVWVQTFPKLTSETAIRLNDVDSDGVLDIIIGYGTGTDGRNVPDFVCMLYFGREPPCLGGIVALNGKNGELVWQHWTRRPVFSVDCSADLTEDGVNECLIGGKGGLLHVVNGHDGSSLWHLEELERQQSEVALDVYSAQFIPDVDDDGFTDVISSHTVSDISGNSVRGHLIITSGKAGRILRMIEMPGGSESYYSPQLLVHPDGEKVILMGTGGTASHSWGGLHAVPLSQLAVTDKVPFQTLVTSDSRGVMSPPALVDINRDGTEDIIVSLFNSTVIAVDGKTFNTLWNYTFPNSQTFSSPTPGYFNDDDVPDFLVKYQYGPDFPVYFYSEMTILDGKTGLPLLEHPVVDSVGSQMGGLSLSMEGQGNDWLLYWTANCKGYEGSQNSFSFAKGSDVVAQSQADICSLRFNSSMVTRLLAINRHIDTPGFPLYSSDERTAIEYNNSRVALDEAAQYLASHPDFWNMFGAQENGVKPTNGEGFPAESVKPTERQSLPYGNMAFEGKQPKGALQSESERGKVGEAEEIERADYSRLPAHQVGKHHKPYSSLADSRDWRLEEAARNYGSFYEPHTAGNQDQDYGSPIMSNSDSLPPQLGSVFNSFLTDSGNDQDVVPQAPPNFFQEHRRSGNREFKRRSSGAVSGPHHNEDVKRNVRFKRESPEKLIDKNLNVNFKNVSSAAHMLPKGIYPITSTGTLAPPLSGSGIDLLLVSYWIPPSEGIQILTLKDMECIKQGVARAANEETDKYANMDQESIEIAVTADCLYQRFSSTSSLESSTNDGRLEPHPGFIPKVASGSTSSYKALNLRLGQLSVYRLNLQCKCRKTQPDQESCAKILPFPQQRWPSFMGWNGKGYFSSK